MELLEKLKELKRERSEAMQFNNIIELEKWADAVQPLLGFSNSHAHQFNQAISRAKSTYRMRSMVDALTNVNEAIGILNQALIVLENRPNEESKVAVEELKVPEKLTVHWLIKHVEIKHWLIVFSFLISVFSAGVYVGQSSLYKQFFQNETKLK